MKRLHGQLVAQLERALKARAETSRATPEVRASVSEFLALLQRSAKRITERGWLVVLEHSGSQDVALDLDAARVSESAIADFARNLDSGGFCFRLECRESDLLAWLDLYVQTRGRKVRFVEACELLRVATAQVLLSPPPNAPGWFGGYDFQRKSLDVDPLAAPMSGRGAASGELGSASPANPANDSAVPPASDNSAANGPSSPGFEPRVAASAKEVSAPSASGPRDEAGVVARVGGGAAAVLRRLFETVETAHDSAVSSGRLDIPGARGTAEELVTSSAEAAHEALREVQYTSFDRYTFGHSVRVALLAVLVGRELEFDERVLVELGTAGLLHDVGKARIDASILFKPGRLDQDERLEMSKHPAFGAEILIEQADAGPLSVCAAFGHHLRYDGNGYPSVPRWYRSSGSTAIVQVCDVFEALTAIRPYKAALSPRRAFEVMFSDAAAFHPVALRALVRCMGLYPPGSRVKLSNGAKAVVLRAGPDFALPTVRITHDELGRDLPENEAPLLDLSLAPDELRIAGALRDPAPHVHTADSHGECCR